MTTKRQQLPRCLWQGLAPCWCSFRLPLTALGLARAIDITPAKQAGRRWDFRVLIGTGGRGGLMAEEVGLKLNRLGGEARALAERCGKHQFRPSPFHFAGARRAETFPQNSAKAH